MRDDTRAYLVAGRVIDSYLLTHRALAQLRDAVAGIDGLAVIAATYELADRQPQDPLYANVAIGFVAGEVPSEVAPGVTSDPLPVDHAAIEAALERARSLDEFTWKPLARLIPPSLVGFTAGQRRASHPPRLMDHYASVALDASELSTIPIRIHLVATGPCAGAVLARGVMKPLPLDEYGRFDDSQDRTAWVFHRGNNETPKHGVLGTTVARVHIEDLGTIAVPADQLTGDLFLLAVYD